MLTKLCSPQLLKRKRKKNKNKTHAHLIGHVAKNSTHEVTQVAYFFLLLLLFSTRKLCTYFNIAGLETAAFISGTMNKVCKEFSGTLTSPSI